MRIEHVVPHMALDDFRHQTGKGSSARGDGVEDASAVLLLRFDGSFNGFDLAFDAPDPADELLLLEMEVCHRNIVYPHTLYSTSWSVAVRHRLKGKVKTCTGYPVW